MGDIWQCRRTFLVVTTEKVQRSGMLLNTLQCTRRFPLPPLPQQIINSAYDVISAEVEEKLGSRGICFIIDFAKTYKF